MVAAGFVPTTGRSGKKNAQILVPIAGQIKPKFFLKMGQYKKPTFFAGEQKTQISGFFPQHVEIIIFSKNEPENNHFFWKMIPGASKKSLLLEMSQYAVSPEPDFPG